MPDTFDLDTAFDTLATEVGGRTAAPVQARRSPPPGDAVRRSLRRPPSP